MFGTKVSFVPIADAYLDGDDIVVAYSKDHVKAAPNVEADGQLSDRKWTTCTPTTDTNRPLERRPTVRSPVMMGTTPAVPTPTTR